MWIGLLWFQLLAAALLCYPRRPLISGGLWIVLGIVSLIQSYSRGARMGALSGAFFVGLGIWYLVKYRDPDVRAKHIQYWTAKA
jgi:hypothetical protein